MSTVPSYFIDFLSNIRLTENETEECKRGHTQLRTRLHESETLKEILVESFLQGSYKRSTAVRPYQDRKKSDIDVVVVTTLDRFRYSAQQALDKFKPFLDKYYPGKYKAQGRSWKIELSYVELDLVPTSAPSEVDAVSKSYAFSTDESLEEARYWAADFAKAQEAKEEQWRKEPLWIPDREAQKWDKTHPLAQIEATQKKNMNCSGHYVNAVKCLKWWRIVKRPEPKYPKSYPLEHPVIPSATTAHNSDSMPARNAIVRASGKTNLKVSKCISGKVK